MIKAKVLLDLLSSIYSSRSSLLNSAVCSLKSIKTENEISTSQKFKKITAIVKV